MRIIVYHSHYGCETGCCGHTVEVIDDVEASNNSGMFEWEHPDNEDPRAFAERLIRELHGEEHVKDLDWANCQITND